MQLDQGLLEQCDGVSLQPGERYLFFASVMGRRYEAKGCERTLPIDRAGRVIAELDATSPASTPATEQPAGVLEGIAANDTNDAASRWAYPTVVAASLAAAGLVLWAGRRR
jgi:hypothetical protein